MARNPYYAGPPSDHFDGTRFFNPGQPGTDRGLRDMLRWKLAGGAARWPRSVPVTTARPPARVDGIRITMVGHATLLVQAGGVNLLTDPVWSARASPFRHIGPRRVTEPGIAFDDLPPIDVVLLSHGHYDHLDIATLRRLQAAHDPLMAMPLGNDAIVRAAVPLARCVTGDWWDRLELGAGIATTLTPANHWSNRWPSDTRMTLWSGHFLDTAAGSIWFVGDTGFGDGRIFGDVRRRLGSPDVALIPIGAYAPRWFMAAQHVDPTEAVRIFTDVGATRALGIHWGTFQLTDEAREAPVEGLAAAVRAHGIAADRFVAAEPGGVYPLRP
ncbi:MBL fold metallo-hydrolase [Sphingomonas sp. KR1UV-12]|uniref:MBL fold metallo-hydrolase n=1 Tax=Sphingomonas aurea TaxID=3063994 RepID=A0ABT9EI20_9SPHN|nr:MBL fold metallo-hydrolase [Sphingomonas sp. KR1UV-12]MDP1026482.1 MBL fold metallo-hydrolase [Sphingomonas sp. KR1UV-12]